MSSLSFIKMHSRTCAAPTSISSRNATFGATAKDNSPAAAYVQYPTFPKRLIEFRVQKGKEVVDVPASIFIPCSILAFHPANRPQVPSISRLDILSRMSSYGQALLPGMSILSFFRLPLLNILDQRL